MSFHVINQYENNPMLQIIVGEILYEFSVADVAPDSRDWLAATVAEKMQQIYDKAYSAGRTSVQNEIKKALSS